MKIPVSKFPASIAGTVTFAAMIGVGASPIWAQNASGSLQSTLTSPDAAAGATWKEVRELTRELDELVSARKLAGVHEAAFNLRDSVRDLRSAASLGTGQAAQLRALIGRIDALANDLDASGDRNDLRATVANQRRLHVLLDQIARLFPNGALSPIGAVEARGAIKDAVCRMTVDAATAAAKVAWNGQTYYFCSEDDAATFRQSPGLYAQRYDQLAFGKPKQYAVNLHVAGRAVAGRPLPMTFVVREVGQSSLVSRFEKVHEKWMHLIMVSEDLSWFSHEHPQIGRDGRFRLNWRFPRAGRYWLFSDFTPSGGNNQIIRSMVSVADHSVDGAPLRSQPLLKPDSVFSKTVEGYDIRVKLSAALRAGRPSLLTYTISRNGQAVTDMQPYLGAMGHLMAIHQNGRDVVHTHTVGAGANDDRTLNVTPTMATPRGPSFTYNLEIPTAGTYKIWAQFQRDNRVITVPFVFRVAPAMAPLGHATTVAKTSSQSTLTSKAKGVREVKVIIDGGYQPESVAVTAGRPVRLTFVRREAMGCGGTVVIPSLKASFTLQSGQGKSVQWIPKHNETLRFSCGMGMYRGQIVTR